MDLGSVKKYLEDFDAFVGGAMLVFIFGLLLIVCSPILIPLFCGYTVYRFCYYLWKGTEDAPTQTPS